MAFDSIRSFFNIPDDFDDDYMEDSYEDLNDYEDRTGSSQNHIQTNGFAEE